MPDIPASTHLYVGLMSGTSMDGVDGTLVSFHPNNGISRLSTLGTANLPFPDALRSELFALQMAGPNEIERECIAANALARLYAQCVHAILEQSGIRPEAVCAIGVHGQTIRHQPARGFTRQINNPALLAELCGIDVIADFRTRDVAAGGQGAPLVPAFHQAVFGNPLEDRAIVNIGGIANLTVLPRSNENSAAAWPPILGFDTGPGNLLMDMWIATHQGAPYDADGAWAAGGKIVPALLEHFLQEPFLSLTPPKSTGRDLFNQDWLGKQLDKFPELPAQDVQATLTSFTAVTIAEAIALHAKTASVVYLCGGGAYNTHLRQLLFAALQAEKHPARVETTEALGIRPSHVEPAAFAWLAARFCARLPGNLPSVTGAAGSRVLGALYPA